MAVQYIYLECPQCGDKLFMVTCCQKVKDKETDPVDGVKLRACAMEGECQSCGFTVSDGDGLDAAFDKIDL